MKSPDVPGRRRSKGRRSTPSLRPPTLMIDLLFGALMLFAFQMGDPNSKTIVPHGIELPADETNVPDETTEVLPLVPVEHVGSGWIYETDDGVRLTAEEVADRVGTRKIAPVLLLSRNISVQKYVDAETPLRKLGLKVGLAVTPEKGKTR